VSKVPWFFKAVMILGAIYALLRLAQIVEAPTVGHVINAALSVALAAFVNVMIWRTFARR